MPNEKTLEASEEKNPRYDKTYVLGQMKRYYEEGIAIVEEKTEDWSNAEAVWDMKFRKTVPDDSLYYPGSRTRGNYLQRAIVRAFMSTTDLSLVSPGEKKASAEEAIISEIQNDIFNMKMNEFEDLKQAFLDDTSTQALTIGTIIGEATWEREYKTEPVFEDVLNEETGDYERKQTGENRILIKNRFRPNWIERRKFLFDTAAKLWCDARWAMKIKIENVADELRAMIDEMGLDSAEVEELIKTGSSKVGSVTNDKIKKAPENEIIETCEFWGMMKIHPDDTRQTFCRIMTDVNFKNLILPPKTTRRYLYFDLKGKPYLPFQLGYLLRKKGEIDGDSIILMSRAQQGEDNSIRNGIRKKAEQENNPIYMKKRGIGLTEEKLKNRTSGTLVEVDDPNNAISTVRLDANIGVSLADLQYLEVDREMLFGANRINMGIIDPKSIPETVGATQLITDSANHTVFAIILRYNNTFFEPFLRMGLMMSIQYTTDEEMEAYGISMQGMDRQQIMRDMNFRIDAGLGATSDQAKAQNLTKMYFLLKENITTKIQMGFAIPPRELFGPSNMLRKIAPIYGTKDVDTYMATLEETMQLTQQQQQAETQMQAQAQAEQTEAARQAGEDAAMEQIMGQGGIAPGPGALTGGI